MTNLHLITTAVDSSVNTLILAVKLTADYVGVLESFRKSFSAMETQMRLYSQDLSCIEMVDRHISLVSGATDAEFLASSGFSVETKVPWTIVTAHVFNSLSRSAITGQFSQPRLCLMGDLFYWTFREEDDNYPDIETPVMYWDELSLIAKDKVNLLSRFSSLV